MKQTFLASDNDDERVSGRGNNASLLLTTVFGVNAGPAVINPTLFKSPRHINPRETQPTLFIYDLINAKLIPPWPQWPS
jgi:hypothetical protein